MPIYRIHPDRLNYQLLHISDTEVRNKLGNKCRFHFDPSPIKYEDIWQSIRIDFYDSSNRGNVDSIPDITVGNGKMYLSNKAFRCMKDLLKAHGEFLPVKYKSQQGYLFNSLSIADDKNALDENLCIKNEWDEMEHIGFIEERLNDTPVFRTEFESYMGFFCLDSFKDRVEENQLTGITFSIDVSNIFPPDPAACAPVSH